MVHKFKFKIEKTIKAKDEDEAWKVWKEYLWLGEENTEVKKVR